MSSSLKLTVALTAVLTCACGSPQAAHNGSETGTLARETVPPSTDPAAGEVDTWVPAVTDKLQIDGAQRGLVTKSAVLSVIYSTSASDIPCPGTGSIQMMFQIAPNGGVSEVWTAGGSLAGTDMENCFLELVRKMSFPVSELGSGKHAYMIDFDTTSTGSPASTADGSLASEHIHAAHKRSLGPALGCPGSGPAKVSFSVGPDGSLLDLAVDTAGLAPETEECVLEAVGALVFPESALKQFSLEMVLSDVLSGVSAKENRRRQSRGIVEEVRRRSWLRWVRQAGSDHVRAAVGTDGRKVSYTYFLGLR